MRMGLFSGTFWGILLIVIGLVAILKSYTNINLSLFRTAVALFLIWTGLVIMLGGGVQLEGEPGMVLFEQRTMPVTHSGEYTTVFGQGTFQVAQPADEGLVLDISAIFGQATVRVPSGVPLKVVATAAFGRASTPDGSAWAFGDRTYTSPGYTEEGPFVRIKVNAVFGGVSVVRVPGSTE